MVTPLAVELDDQAPFLTLFDRSGRDHRSELLAAVAALDAAYQRHGGEQALGRARALDWSAWLLDDGSRLVCNYRYTRAFRMSPEIHTKLLELGAVDPEADQQVCSDRTGRRLDLVGGRSIWWHPRTGAHVVAGRIRQRWIELGAEQSHLGYPTADEIGFESGRSSRFQHGELRWTPQRGVEPVRPVR